MDPSAFVESLQRGLSAIPPIAIALVLLAGPTVALIGYRLVFVARRRHAAPEASIVPFWVCSDCRSVNELRVSRCYRCGLDRDASADVEIVVDQPTRRTAPVDLPAGSPFSAIASGTGVGPGRPVMAERSFATPIPVGPDPDAEPVPAGSDPVAVKRVDAER